MSALADMRRDQATRSLERDYYRLREHVVLTVRASLRRRGIHADDADLEAHYNTAFQGLHSELRAGTVIENPEGFLVTIVLRRGLDDARRVTNSRRAIGFELTDETVAAVSTDIDVASHLDDVSKLKHLREALSDRLSSRECEVATLCYLQEYTRPEAAQELGIAEKRVQKIMDAVTKKVGGLLRDIEAGEWCEARRSLMNAYAFGVLEEGGPRHTLALDHLGECPGCRRYVLAARGLAGITPPVLLPLGAGGGIGELLEGLGHAVEAAGGKAAAAGATHAGGGSLATGVASAGGGAASTGGAGLLVKAAVTAAVLASGGGAAVATGALDSPPKPAAQHVTTSTTAPTVTPTVKPASTTRPKADKPKAKRKRKKRAISKPIAPAASTPAPEPAAQPAPQPAPQPIAPSSSSGATSGSPSPAPAPAPAPTGGEFGVEG